MSHVNQRKEQFITPKKLLIKLRIGYNVIYQS